MAPLRARCSNCGQAASPDRRFCGACGARLWEPCLACQTLNSVAEKYCSECGGELEPAVAAAVAQLDGILQTASLLESEGKLLEAVELLSTVAPSEHGRLADRVHEANRLRQQLADRREQIVANLFERVAEAQHLVDQRQYAAALATLEQIPASLRNQQARTLLNEVQARVSEIGELRSQISQAVKQGATDQLLRQVQRLRELEPHAADIEKLWHQLTTKQGELNAALARKLLKKARDAIVANDYRVAEACLQRMPVTSPEGTHEIFDAIAERVWLARQITSAPFADQTLLAIANRLVKLQPKDETAKLWLGKIQERLARVKSLAGEPLAPWVKPTEPSRFGAPVAPVDKLANLNWDAPAIEAAGGECSLRRQLTAIGLALVGIDKAKLDLDLRPERTSWRKRLAEVRNLNLGRNTSAWGLDLGVSGLKFVRLAVNKAGEICVDRAGVIPFSAESRLNENTDVPLGIEAALKEFIERQQPAAEPVVLGLPGTQTLARCFQLPRLKPARRFAKLLEYEVRTQIPLPLDEVEYGAHVWDADEADEAAAVNVRVTVAAAKLSHLEMRLSSLSNLELRLDSLQSECAALINVLHLGHADEIAQLPHGRAIALVEVGDASTNVAIASRQGSCFRAVHLGVRSLNKSLARARSSTIAQADALRHQWHTAETLHRLDADLTPALDELTRAVRHALDTCTSTLGAQLAHIYVAGGGCYQFGLLRQWALPESRA
jgi:Tfp pilus assembly PilM family ATPase